MYNKNVYESTSTCRSYVSAYFLRQHVGLTLMYISYVNVSVLRQCTFLTSTCRSYVSVYFLRQHVGLTLAYISYVNMSVLRQCMFLTSTCRSYVSISFLRQHGGLTLVYIFKLCGFKCECSVDFSFSFEKYLQKKPCLNTYNTIVHCVLLHM